MDFIIRQLRLTSIWTEVFPVVLQKTLPDDVLLGKLAREVRYKEPFSQAIQGVGEFTMPWRMMEKLGENFFWKFYLKMGAYSLQQASPHTAWRRLVPLRIPVKGQIKLALPEVTGRVTLEEFFYPHGTALLAHVTINTPQPLFTAVETAVKTRRDKAFAVMWSDGKEETLNLDTMCIRALDDARARAMGDHVAEGIRPQVPFTVASVVDAELPSGFEITEPVQDDDVVHRALDGLCTLHDGFQHNTLESLAAAKLKTRQAAASHVLYARNRARAVWYPSEFNPRSPKRSVSCYHRNLVLASTQTQAVIEFLKIAATALEAHHSIPASMRKLAKSAGGLAGQLFAGSADIYRTASTRRQLLDCDALDEINLVREQLECGPQIP